MGHEEKSYLVTYDAPRYGDVVRHLGVKVNSTTIEAMDHELERRLRKAFPDHRIDGVGIDFLAVEMKRLASEAQTNSPDARIVTTNPFLCHWPNCPDNKSCCLQLNRIVMPDGVSMGIGPRPWHSPIHQQFHKLAEELDGRPIILLEDGVWSGGTIVRILSECLHYNIEIADMICGILFDKGHIAIEKAGYRKDPLAVMTPKGCIDWVPDHDFFPFFPCCGKIVGDDRDRAHGPTPHELNGFSRSIPYILPYGNPRDWASIPEDKTRVFSIGCLGDTIEFFTELETLNGFPIYDSFIKDLFPRVSLPHKQTDELPVSHDNEQRRIVEILSADYDTLRRN